jgi:hypothetical protein
MDHMDRGAQEAQTQPLLREVPDDIFEMPSVNCTVTVVHVV